ncbi:MAG: hypothetical protein ABI895_39475 [Deltaproteobacteria bacterium]
MMRRFLFVFGFVLAGCGDSGEPEDELAGANRLTTHNVAMKGNYCCYENGAVSADSAAACTLRTSNCVWSETYNDVDPAGRGTMCGYLACH